MNKKGYVSMKDLSRNITLLCPICGNSQFVSLDDRIDEFGDALDQAQYKCSDCGSIFTKEQLLEENSEKIDIAIGEIKNDALKEFDKELKKAFKKWR